MRLTRRATHCAPRRQQSFIRWRLRVMEENVRAMDLECLERSSVSFVHDLRGLPYSMVMSRKVRSTVARLITLLNDNYPEMAAKHIIVFGPYFLSVIMSLLQPFISPQTQEKFAVFPAGSTAAALAEELGPGLSEAYLDDVAASDEEGASSWSSWLWPW